jgi:hypothetical protein
MTEERFLQLASAYGADLARWPEAERAAAAAVLARRPDIAVAVLAAERDLEAALARYAPPDPGPALRQRVIGAAPRGRAIGRAWRWLAGAGLGLGLAASCAAGVAAGLSFAPHSVVHMFSPARSGDELSSLADPFGDAAGG